MRMSMTLTLTDDRTFDVKTGAADFAACERHFDVSLIDKFGTDETSPSVDLRFEWLIFMAWNCLRRRMALVDGETVGTFDAFMDRVEDLEVEDVDDNPPVEAGSPGD